MASHSLARFVNVPSGKVKLSGDSAIDMERLLDQAAALATRMLKLEVLSDELQWVGHVGPDCDVVNFLCQLSISHTELDLHTRWMWQLGDDWLNTACLAVHFREAVTHLSAVSVLVHNEDDSLSMSSGSTNSNVSDAAEYADRVINASHGIWITDNRRKSSRKRTDIARLVQLPTGIQREVLTPGEFAAAEGIDTADESSSESDFR